MNTTKKVRPVANSRINLLVVSTIIRDYNVHILLYLQTRILQYPKTHVRVAEAVRTERKTS